MTGSFFDPTGLGSPGGGLPLAALLAELMRQGQAQGVAGAGQIAPPPQFGAAAKSANNASPAQPLPAIQLQPTLAQLMPLLLSRNPQLMQQLSQTAHAVGGLFGGSGKNPGMPGQGKGGAPGPGTGGTY